ncbi:MAG TPA: class I SAM-dependent methyltransferase [Candidatus Manganitrophaceae bacterium]|nr:class I SAM-dependent methyltransferase [Candidatus Manganitrophaceae bacterium]
MSVYASQKKYFEKAYATGEHGWPVEGPSQPVVRFISRYKKEKPEGRVLDIGCGEGRHALLFARHGYQAVGLDYEPLALARAKRFARNGSAPSSLQFILGDVFHLPFAPQFFDVVLDYGCLHHVRKRDTASYLQNVSPLLKPGGYFLISCFSTRFKHHPGEKRSRDWMVHNGHYDRFFRKENFKEVFGRDFVILRIEEERQSLYAFYHVLMRKKGA